MMEPDLFRRLWLLSIIGTVSLWSANGLAATTAYVATTQNLDLNHVQLVVVASPESKARLQDQATALFAEAGLPVPASPTLGSSSATATLTLTLHPRLIGDACPGKVLYAPSLSLTEPVIIPRNLATISDITWLWGNDPQVGDPLDASQLQADVDRLVLQFITDYKAGNPEWPSHMPAHIDTPRADGEPADLMGTKTENTDGRASLKDLREHPIHVSVTAGRATEPLRNRAVHQLTEGGLRVSSVRNGAAAVTVDVELVQRPIDDQCPGKVLYEGGLYLIEQVQIQRNPLVWIWTDTWLREIREVRPPATPHQLQMDQDALLQLFLHSVKAR